jgi:hypothetical protein
MNMLAARGAQSRMAEDFAERAICGPVVHAPAVGRGVDDMVAAIRLDPA